MKVSIIKYNAGNVYSVECALRRLGVTPVVSDSPDVLSQSDKVLFPGVGEASSAMKYLQEHGLDRVIVDLTQPVLAICIGLQLLCKHSEEGDVDTLGSICKAQIQEFEHRFNIQVDKYVIMPNHLHMLLSLADTNPYCPRAA